MSNNIILSNTATLSLEDTDYILTVALLINNASNGTSNNTSNDVFNLTLIEGNNIVSNTYLQSVISNFVSNTQVTTDISIDTATLDGGSF